MNVLAHALSALFLLTPQASLAQSVTVLGQVVLGETKLDGEKFGEFSALVREPVGDGVLAISDRGYIAQLNLVLANGRLTDVLLVSATVLMGSDGIEMREHGFNPEAAALLNDGTIAIVSENGPRLAVFDHKGKWLRDEGLPLPLRDASRQISRQDGIEALAWTQYAGFLALTEEPQRGAPRNFHALHSTLSGSVEFSTKDADAISIKSMETVGNWLVLLERTRKGDTAAIQPWVRLIDLAACFEQTACMTKALPIGLNGLSDADFEGLVSLDDQTFLMVSDDKVDGDLRTVFVMFRVGI